MSNSDNPKNGAIFQSSVRDWFQDHYKMPFELEKKLPIGSPSKDHKFDIVDSANTIAIECKRYTWTETGNVPSAKMGFVNEAAFYLSFLPDSYSKYIVMLHSCHEKRKETLAAFCGAQRQPVRSPTAAVRRSAAAGMLRGPQRPLSGGKRSVRDQSADVGLITTV